MSMKLMYNFYTWEQAYKFIGLFPSTDTYINFLSFGNRPNYLKSPEILPRPNLAINFVWSEFFLVWTGFFSARILGVGVVSAAPRLLSFS
jgi:hypothetical protein